MRTLLVLVALSLPPLASAGAQQRGIVLAAIELPPAGSAYRGGTHTFPGGIRLTCGSHGGFTSAVAPPTGPGSTVIGASMQARRSSPALPDVA